MVTSKPARTFGKRGSAAAARSTASRGSTSADLQVTESGLPLSEIAASLMQRPAAAEAVERRTAGEVPTSWRAGVLAGLVVALLQAGLVIAAAKAQSSSLSGFASVIGINAQTMVPVVIAGSLLNSAQTTGFTVLVAHRLLKRLAIASPMAYAFGGAATAVACAAAWFILGFGGPQHGWTLELATGFGAGFFYRLFAGAAAS